METQSSPVLDPETKTKTRFYPRWQVLGIDDDVTPMDYVVMVLVDIFHKSLEEAHALMLDVHHTGAAVFYMGSKEACELKVDLVRIRNKEFDQVLKVVMEPIED